MRFFALTVMSLFLAACTPRSSERIDSPNGSYTVWAEISGNEADPTRRMCVRLKIEDKTTKAVKAFQTGASDYSAWAIGWQGDAVVLYSSDIGTYAYDIGPDSIHERAANLDEEMAGRSAYEKKYDRRPHAGLKSDP